MRIQTKLRLLVLQFLITTAMVVAEVPQTAFQSLRFEAALKRAELERKIVFADFYTTWCGPCKKLDQETWKDPAVISLLREKTIALRIDAEKEPELASRFKVNAYPTLALIRPDGTLIDSLVGYRDAPTFSKEFAAILAGKTQFALAREALEKAGADVEKQVKARYDLGRVLAQKGDDAGSLKEFLWCFDDGMKNHPAYAGVRVSFLLNDLARLGAHYPPALDALRVRRDADRTRFADDRSVALEFGSLNHALGEDQVTLAAFDQLPADNVQREVLGHQVFDLLLAAKRYPEAAAASPFAEYTAHFDMVRASKIPDDAKRRFLADLAGKELEALAGAGKLDNARELLTGLFEYDHSEATVSVVQEHVKRAGHPELLLQQPPPAVTPVAPPSGAVGL